MRARALLTAGLAVLGLATTPSHAASSASIEFQVQFACLGCGWTPASMAGTCTGLCFDTTCTGCDVYGNGEAYTAQGSCEASGEMYGDATVANHSGPFTLTWSEGSWTMWFDDGTTAKGDVTFGGCEGPGEAAFTGTLGDPPSDATEVSYNDGETGVLLLATSNEMAFADGPTDAHDLSAGCTYKYSRHAGIVTIVGRTHAGRHPSAATTTIRCRLVDPATGVVLFDQTRTEPGPSARLEGTVPASPNRVTVCTRGEGWWGDAHTMAVGLVCKAP